MKRSLIVATFFVPIGCIETVDLGVPQHEQPREHFPQRDEWRIAIETDLADDVSSIVIGGVPFEKNFSNRGDVEVHYDGAEGQIVVEARRFTFAPCPEEAEPVFEKLWVWAYAGETLQSPHASMGENDCSVLWHEGCELRVYYDGQVQPERSGADLRVTLPPSFRGHLELTTEDSTTEDSYPLRGDVRIHGLPGSAEINTQRGTVEVSLAESALPAPACGPAVNEACAAWEEDGEGRAWDLACGCTDFGRVQVEAWSSDVTVDVPSPLWAHFSLQNVLKYGNDPGCEVDVRCEDFGGCEMWYDDPLLPGRKEGEFNDPGDSALEGAGYYVWVKTEACLNVSYVDQPGDYKAPMVDRRGDLTLCSGCLD